MIGQTVGKYRIEAKIGRGGMGTVYRAIDETLHRDVAIKVLNSELDDPEVAKRFRAEAITVAKLNHTGIATVYELFQHEGQWLMVMEFVKGETLERLVERAGPLSPERASEITMHVLNALAHAHELGVVHRDLKPANLMMTDTGAIKVMDFGIARVSGSEHLTSAGFMMGTPAYMAPEQVLGHEVDARSDLYSMGVVLYRLTTAKLPFKGDTLFSLAQSQVNDPPTPVRMAREGLPMWLDQVLSCALAKAPAHRFQTATEFRIALERCLSGQPVDLPYDSTATTRMHATPVGMPTGSYSPAASGAHPYTASSELPTALHQTPLQTASQQFRAPTSSMPPQPVAAAPQAPVAGAAQAPTRQKPAARGRSGGMWIGISAGVVLLLAVGGFFLRRSKSPATDPVVPPPAEIQQAAPPAADPSAGQPAAGAVSSSTPPATSAPAVTPAPAPVTPPPAAATTAASKPVLPAVPPAQRGTSVSPDAAARGAAPATTAPAGAAGARADAGRSGTTTETHSAASDPADTLVTFSDAKLLTFDGKKGKDQDVLLHFGSGQLAVTPKKGGAPLMTVAYKKFTRAIYVYAKDPKWDTALAGLPDGMDIPGFMRGTRNWLVLQSKTDYLVLYLDDANWREVVSTLEARTGLKVDRQ